MEVLVYNIYENKDMKYFAISNSFLLLEEYLLGK